MLTPLAIIVVVGIVALIVEYLFMALLHGTLVPLLPFKLSDNAWNLIDAVTLTAALSPALYFLVFRKMQESEERFRQINASVHDAILVVNEQCLITEWNLAAQKMFQYSREEVLGRPMHQLLAAPRYHADAARGFARFQEIGTGPLIGKTTEVAGVRKNRSEIPIELSLSAAKVKGRWYAMGIMRDITERKRHEARLKNNEERYRNIIQTSMDCFWLIDTEGRILDVNDAYCQLSGYTREELLNMRIPEVEARETPDVTAQHIQEVMTKGYARFETRHRRKDGQLLDIGVSVIYRQDSEGGHFFAFLHDITGRKQAEEKIRQLAFHDTLTQLPNRRLLNDRVEQTMAASKRSGLYGALMFMDLDNFKPLNDTYGHETGICF
jgi:PAS domain S-box-containing protein